MEPNFSTADHQGLLPVVVQDAVSQRVLMLGWTNAETYKESIDSKRVVFYSRSRKSRWLKGETSGNYFNIVSSEVDCDSDAILYKVNPVGPACHTGKKSCFDDTKPAQNSVESTTLLGESAASHAALVEAKTNSDLDFLIELESVIQKRKESFLSGTAKRSYVQSLFQEGSKRIFQKVGEEATEFVIESLSGTRDKQIEEGADLLFHLLVGLNQNNLSIKDIVNKLAERS